MLRLRCWTHKPYQIQTVRSRVQENIWDAFDGEDIEIAYPHSHLFFDETSGELQVSTDADGDHLAAATDAEVVTGTEPADESLEEQ